MRGPPVRGEGDTEERTIVEDVCFCIELTVLFG